jgi:hypothetical protein
MAMRADPRPDPPPAPPVGRMLAGIFGALAEYERSLIAERAEAAEAARVRGAFGAEVVEEPTQGLLGAVLPGPHQPAGVVTGHDQQISLSQ